LKLEIEKEKDWNFGILIKFLNNGALEFTLGFAWLKVCPFDSELIYNIYGEFFKYKFIP